MGLLVTVLWRVWGVGCLRLLVAVVWCGVGWGVGVRSIPGARYCAV